MVGWLARVLHPNGTIRIVSYHDVLDVKSFEEHLRFFQRYFIKCTKQDFMTFLEGGALPSEKPLIVLSFDDGLRSHYKTVLPLLEKWGFLGLFLVPTEFLSCTEQRDYVKQHRIPSKSTYPDGRLSLTLEELRELAQSHIIVCHTHSHRRLGSGVPAEEAKREIAVSNEILSNATNNEFTPTNGGFGWVGGEMSSYSRQAVTAIKEAGFRYALITKPGLNSEKTNKVELRRSSLDDSWPVSLVSLHLCGLFDVLYWGQKRKISRLYQ